MMQTNRHRTFRSVRRVLAAAVVGPAVALLVSPARAQYPVQNGNARDANNRVGSYGQNGGGNRVGPGVTPNQVVYGNVTGNRAFRGPIGAPDARAFRGPTADTNSDRFVRDSTGGYDRSNLAQSFEARPYYGESRAVAPPPGYIPPTATYGTPWSQTTSFGNPYAASGLAGLNTGEGLVPRLGTTSSVLNSPLAGQQSPGSPGGPGTYLRMSPLGGIRQVTVDPNEGGAAGDYYGLRGADVVRGTAGDRFRADNKLVDQIRNELSPGTDPLNVGRDPTGIIRPGQRAAGQASPGQASPGQLVDPALPEPLGRPLGAAAETPSDPTLGGSRLPTGRGVGAQPLGGSTNTGQSVRRQLAAPAEQMEQFGELERRFRQRQGNRPVTDQQAAQQLRDLRPVNPNMVNPLAPKRPGQSQQPGQSRQPGQSAPGGSAAPAATPGRVQTPVAPPLAVPGAARPDPLKIKSLAAGVKAKTLAQVLSNAEELMQQGKYSAALDQYALAEQAAPNNPLITLGRSNAELGASNYRSAEQNLRRALGSEAALLLAKYDLRSMIGSDRLNVVTKDLKDLATGEPKETMAPLLLAYIAYNTGNEAEAEGYLNQVDQRAGAADPLTTQMRRFWEMSAPGPNK